MRLSHSDVRDYTHINVTLKQWVDNGSGKIGFSKYGGTAFWSGGFAGCVGVVMCGKGSWGVVAHLNQNIQYGGRCLETALTFLSEFINTKMKSPVTDVLIYYGDYPGNLGRERTLSVQGIKNCMGCERVIDLRRTSDAENYGSDFVYDPSSHTVYTVQTGNAAGYSILEKTEIKTAYTKLTQSDYGGPERSNAISAALGKGWFSLV